MYEIKAKRRLNATVSEMQIYAPLVAEKAKAGQFVILRVEEEGERIPLTIAGYDRENGTVKIVYQIVGATTMRLDLKEAGDTLCDFVGPLGNSTKVAGIKKAIVVGGGVGCAIALPMARALREAGAEVSSVVGFRSKDLVIFEEEFKEISSRFSVVTDDGSYGEKGNVCLPLEKLLSSGERFDAAFVVGPLVMMKYAAEVTKKYGVKTVASMNPVMIDGTGMCGCCRLTVGNEVKFACVDGPEFDAHAIDFDEAINRSKAYAPQEEEAKLKEKQREEHCNLFKKQPQEKE